MTSMTGSSGDGGTFDDASSVTLQDEFPWHEVGIKEHEQQRIPSMIFPALLHTNGDNNYASPSPLRPFCISSLLVDDEPDGGGASSSAESDAEMNALRYSITEKGKGKAETDDEDGGRRSRLPSPQFCFPTVNSVEDWVMHNRPILQEYADRQTSLPLGERLEVSIDEPSDFVLGSLQLLVNRDRKDCTDRSRRLGPQLIENFVNIDRWAKEYFRSRHGVANVCNDVSTLLTIVMNGFYEGLVQLIDRLVEFALERMRFCGGTSLAVTDFSFGYDFRMSQDLPFCVETSSRIREPLPIHPVEVRPDSEPVTTHSGRQVKPTKRAQEACEQAATSERRGNGKGIGSSREVKGKQAPKGAVAPSRRRKSSAQHFSGDPESDRTTLETSLAAPMFTLPPRKAMPDHARHRPARPSSLGLPPISPTVLSSETLNERSVPASKASEVASASTFASTSVSASADDRSTPGCSESDVTAGLPPSYRLKIVIPRRAVSRKLPGAVTSSYGSITPTTTTTTATEANTKSIVQTSLLGTASKSPAAAACGIPVTNGMNTSSTTLQASNSLTKGRGHARGHLFGSSVAGGTSGLSVDGNTGGESGGRYGDSGRLRESGSIELTLNAGSSGPTDGMLNQQTRTVRAGAKGKGKGKGKGKCGDPPMESTNSTGTQVGGTGDVSSSCGDRLGGINTVDDNYPTSGNIDTREKESPSLAPPSDHMPGPGSSSGRLKGKKRKLDEYEY